MKIIYLWSVDLEKYSNCFGASLESVLSVDETRRAKTYRTARDKTRFVAGRAFLRTVLALHCQTHPQEIGFVIEANGKPLLGNVNSPHGQFSFSKSNGFAVCGFTEKHPIGLDLEVTTTIDELSLVAATIFSRDEFLQWENMPCSQRTACFYRAWTRKEAVGKTTGIGISGGPDQLAVPLEELPSHRTRGLASVSGGPLVLSDWCAFEETVASIVFLADQDAYGEMDYDDEHVPAGRSFELFPKLFKKVPEFFSLTIRRIRRKPD